MASLIQAISTYRPRLATTRVVDLDELVERRSRGSLVTPPIARLVIDELCEGLAQALSDGEAVRLPGIGVFRPEVRLDGSLRPRIVFDRTLRRRLRSVRDFRGKVTNRGGIGVDVAGIRARWDAEHPGDVVVG